VTQRARIDPDSRIPLESMLRDFPGGVNRIPDLATRRQIDEQLARDWADQNLGADGVIREDIRVPRSEDAPDLTLRVYRPVSRSGSLPCIYFIHGGGMIMGSLLSEDHVASMLCERVGALVVSVDYRLAPENPYPIPVDDCFVWIFGGWLFMGAALVADSP
jgi:acetyl esterase/lipase